MLLRGAQHQHPRSQHPCRSTPPPSLFCGTAEAERQQALSKLESLFDFIVPLISFLLSIWHFAILIQSYNGNEFLEGMAGQPRFLDNVLGKAFT